jgi:hypothetical protein
MEIRRARFAGLYVYGGVGNGSDVKASIDKTRLGIGIVTLAMLLASSAANSSLAAPVGERASSRPATPTGLDLRRQARWWKPARPVAAAPHYYGRPSDYAPAYRPGPFVLFTPFFD